MASRFIDDEAACDRPMSDSECDSDSSDHSVVRWRATPRRMTQARGGLRALLREMREDHPGIPGVLNDDGTEHKAEEKKAPSPLVGDEEEDDEEVEEEVESTEETDEPSQKRRKVNSNVSKKTWLLTFNNPTIRDLRNVKGLDYTYLVIAKEVAPTTGTKHYHCFLILKKNMRFSGLKSVCGRANIKWVQYPSAAEAYVRKGGCIVFEEDRRRPGRRSDLDTVAAQVVEGRSLRAIALEHPSTFIRYNRGINTFRETIQPISCNPQYNLGSYQDWEPITNWNRAIILWGDSGIGKTGFALAHFRNPLMVTHMDDMKQFQAEVHDGIVFDDMAFNHLPREAQIHLVDYDFARTIHARYVAARIPARTKKIFTTNVEEGRILNVDDAAIARRVTVIHLGVTRFLTDDN
jgi:hypothetical protein